MKGQVIEIVGSGDLAYLRGTWTMTISIPGVPAPINEHGNMLLISRKQSDGVWKITREMLNSDVPEPAPAPPPK
jgi:ketosteroid isomerase-like protein